MFVRHQIIKQLHYSLYQLSVLLVLICVLSRQYFAYTVFLKKCWYIGIFSCSRCIKMALVHDLGESVVGDLTPHCGVSREEKHQREKVSSTSD